MIKHQSPKTLFPFIWHFLRQYKTVVVIYCLLAFAAGFVGPFNSLLIKKLINLLPQANAGDVSMLVLPASLIVVNFIIFDNFTWRGITFIRAKFVPVILNQVDAYMMGHVLGSSHQFFQNKFSGKIARQIGILVDGLESIINVMANFLRAICLLLTAFISSYYVNPIFSYTLLVWFIVFAVSSVLMSRKFVLLSDLQTSVGSKLIAEWVDAFSNHSNVRIFGRRDYELTRRKPLFDRFEKAYKAQYFYALIMHSIQGGLIAIMMSSSCYFLVYLYSKNLVTVGDFALILGLSMETGHMMWFTTSQVDEFNKAVGRSKEALSDLLTTPEIEDKPDAAELKCTNGQIIFDRVKFQYEGAEPLFENKSIEIKAGEKVGLVGSSGGGKSTFVNLILRLYDVSDGTILIDEQDIRNVTQDSLRENIAMIPQDPSLFYRSLMENIRYGRIDATDEEVIEAAKKAYVHEFVQKLPQGYDTLVGERGVKLSGGQRQRVAIARAILKNAPILILDEATSQLDSVTENLIQASLWELMENKTTIVIAHRLSTLLHMDRILVFDKGKIVEDGTHNELITKGKFYKRFWDAQIGGFLGDDPLAPETSV